MTPIRIYLLAKQLNKENKEIVDVCRKLGFPGKRVALSRLTPEEAERITGYFASLDDAGNDGLIDLSKFQIRAPKGAR
ncbi:MAG: translation initiation factor IF-2 N-terminal domain-containing protein [Thermoguttaceae bacterium]|nr:translation initiation factor IF-2 N-terminal domain-containing protein [Thermoguttaceae bacterium]